MVLVYENVRFRAENYRFCLWSGIKNTPKCGNFYSRSVGKFIFKFHSSRTFRIYPKIIGFWTSTGPIVPKLGQSNVLASFYRCLKDDTTQWLIRGHITKCYILVKGWLNTLIDTSKWSQVSAVSVECHMTPLGWLIRVFGWGHITFDNILSFIQVSDLFQSLKWSDLNELSPNCNMTSRWWLICLFIRSHITKNYILAWGWVNILIDTSKWSQLNAVSVECCDTSDSRLNKGVILCYVTPHSRFNKGAILHLLISCGM